MNTNIFSLCGFLVIYKETKELLSKIFIGKDGNRVKHIETGKVFNSLAKACRELNLNYKREDARIRRNFSTKQFIKIE